MVRFTLQDIDGVLVFGAEKVSNWDALEPKLVRSDDLFGQVTELTNSFTFIDNVRTRIISNYDKYGNNAFVSLKIEIGDNNNTPSSYVDISYGASLVAKWDDYSNTELGVTISFAESDFQQKIMTNEKEALRITLDTNLQGGDVTDYKTLLKSTYCHDRTLEFNSQLRIDEEKTLDIPLGNDYFPIPYTVEYKSDDDIKTNIFLSTDNISDPILYYLLKAEESKVLNVDYDIDFKSTFTKTGASGAQVYLIEVIIDVDGNIIDSDIIVPQQSILPNQNTTLTFKYSASKNISLEEGYSIGVIFQIINISGVISLISSEVLSEGGIFINSTSYFPATVSNTILPHEFFTHWIELMTGKKNSFYSEFFGRVDLGYSEDGEGAYWAICDGYMVRNMPIEEYSMTSNFRDRLDDAIKTFGLAAQIQYLGDTEVFRVEKRSRLLLNEIVIDLGELYSGVSLSNSADRTYTKAICGYDDIELENLNGLQIYNGELNYSLNINADENVLDLKCKGIAADYALEQARRLQFSVAPNEDGKNDKKIFYILCKKGSSPDLIALRGSDYNDVSGILSPNNAYNIGISPARMLRNNGDLIKACILEDQELILTKSASNNTLSADGINEGSNVDSSEFSNALYLNQDISIESAPADLSQWLNISEKRNGIITFVNKGISFYMYHDMISYKYSEETINIEGRRANR